MISSTAASADARSVTATSCGQRSSSGVAWARGEPTKTARSPSRSVRPRSPSGDAPVQVPDGGELLSTRQQLVGLHRLARGGGGDESLGVLAFHPFGPLQVQEVPQGPLAERQQVQLQPGGEIPGALREVRPAQGGSGA